MNEPRSPNLAKLQFRLAKYPANLLGIPGHYFFFELPLGFRNRTPGPPPFSSMNSTPAVSRARRTAKLFETVIAVTSAINSARRMVATLKVECLARSSALQRMRARAARICALLSKL